MYSWAPSHNADVSIGEETSEVQGKPVLTDAFTWIVDPIDVSCEVCSMD